MLRVQCSGTPHEIGIQHGSAASSQILRCIDYYSSLFHEKCALDWEHVRSLAESFAVRIKAVWPAFYDEMEGIAQGSGRSILDIVALNVRTEIAFGCFSDGCTSLSWHTENHSFLAQNWDWHPAQKQNLILLSIHHQCPKPSIKMITEAGIIGKIGFNSAGVGVCLNVIRAKESPSAKAALDSIGEWGIASSAHILIADAQEAMGCEFTSTTSAIMHADSKERVIHSNHLLLSHPGVVDTVWLRDSPFRAERMRELSDGGEGEGEVTWDVVASFSEDRENAPAGICRMGETETLFNVLGMPDFPEEVVELAFDI
ncbi:hypothetical protein BDW59DRAFT_179673 [Aspergillus cavernicola]|uniref:Peptidase C45 hydrolase domain-containing protein n=1 Tax=Aspergillus cavernicola TaxID=176166 RepID=A0ABR4IED0_9EURO